MKTQILSRLTRALPVALALAAAPLAAPAQDAAPVKLGPLVISGGFTRATLPHAPVGGGFMTITNTGGTDDRLVSAASPVADHVEIHEMSMVGDVMKMQPLPDGLPIPAGETVTLQPGGYHLMLMGLKERLEQGATVAVTLTFSNAGTVEVPLAVGPINAGSQGMKEMKGGSTMDDSTGGNRIDNGMTHEMMPGDDGSAPASMG